MADWSFLWMLWLSGLTGFALELAVYLPGGAGWGYAMLLVHVALAMAHLKRHLAHDPDLRPRLAAAVESRFDSLREMSGLNEEVFDALVLLAAGRFEADAIARGHAAVLALKNDMDAARRHRLEQLGFAPNEAERLSSLHTRNFM